MVETAEPTFNGKDLALLKNGLKNVQNYNSDEDNSDDEMENRLEDVGIVRAPDGGYGWVVVFASFLANMVVDGVIFSISETIVPLWEREFHSTTSATTIATSLLAGCYLLSGPLGSSLANSFGCNWVAVGGAVISASGFLLTVLAPGLPVVYVTFGIVGGIGYGLIFLPAVVIVSQYFSEKRALATGIAVCGSGIGTSLFSYLNPLILRTSNGNWRIFLVVLACVNFACIFIGYFFKSLQPSKTQIEEATKITTSYIDRHGFESGEPYKRTLSTETKNSLVVNLQNGVASEGVETTTSPHVAQGVAIERFERDAPPPAAVAILTQQNRAAAAVGASFTTVARRNADRPFLSTIELHAGKKFEKVQEKSTSRADLAIEVTKASMADLNRPLSKMDIFYSGSMASLHRHMSSGSARRRATTTMHLTGETPPVTDLSFSRSALYLSTAGLPSAIYDEENGDDFLYKMPRWIQGIVASLRSILDVSLLKSFSFLMLAVGGFLSLACFFVPFMFIGALAKQNGVDESLTKYLVTILGLVNLAARVICGLISDHPRVDPLVVSNVAVIAGGIATSLAPLCTQFWMFAAYCIPFAFGVACFAALRSVICVELLGIERLTNAYGILMLFMGVAALIGPPFAALLKNLTNSFHMSFHVMGVVMILSGLVGIPLRRVAHWEAAKTTSASTQRDGTKLEAGDDDEELQPLNVMSPLDKTTEID